MRRIDAFAQILPAGYGGVRVLRRRRNLAGGLNTRLLHCSKSTSIRAEGGRNLTWWHALATGSSAIVQAIVVSFTGYMLSI